MKTSISRAFGVAALILVVAACSKKDDAKKATLSTNWLGKSVAASSMGVQPLSVGQGTPGTGGLKKFEYFFSSVMICESANFSGTGWTAPQGCSSLYANGGDVDYNNYLLADGDNETTDGRYIDVLSTSSLAKMNRNLEVSPGSYKIGFVNFMRPFRVQAEINDGTNLLVTKKTGSTITGFCGYTGSGGKTVSDCSNPLDYFERRIVADMVGTTGTSELASFMMTNGGTQFVFSNAVTVAESDSVTMDLVVDPDYLVTAGPIADGVNGTYCEGTATACDTSKNAMSFPFIDIAPVIRKGGQNTYRAVYETPSAIATGVTGNTQTVRVSIYFAGTSTSDFGTTSIQAVNIRTIGTAKAMAVTGGGAQEAVVADGKVTINSWEHTATIQDLPVTTTLNQQVTGVSVNFANMGLVGGTTTTGVTFELKKIEQVN